MFWTLLDLCLTIFFLFVAVVALVWLKKHWHDD